MKRAGSPKGHRALLPRRRFVALLWGCALLAPVVYLPRTLVSPLSLIPCGRPEPNHLLGDPVINLSVMGRAWNRFDAADYRLHDDRVLAPYPDAWPLGEPFILPALVGYPFARLSGSLALGYDVPYLLSCVVGVAAAGALLAEVAGPGWVALGGALLWGWGPARLNNLGVLSTLWSGFVPLGLTFVIRFLRRRRTRDAAFAAAAWVALGLGSLYGLVMGSTVLALLLVVAATEPAARRRLPVLVAAFVPVAAFLAAVYEPLFHLREAYGIELDQRVIEGHAADLAALLHEGVFSGPLRSLFDPIVPGLPEGASALFPPLAALAALGAAAALLRRPATGRRRGRFERSLVPWGVVAAASFLFALGPTVRLLGRPLLPGPYRLLDGLPVFGSVRGIHRWDQWFDLGLVVASAIAASRVLRTSPAPRRRLLLLGAAPLLLLDLWPRAVPAQAPPGPSPFAAAYASLPRDAVTSVYPWSRANAERSWGEQLYHRRRALVGFWSVSPDIHLWLSRFSREGGLSATVAVYRELGAGAVEVRTGDLEAADRAALGALVADPGPVGIRAVERHGDLVLLLLDARAPILVDPSRLSGLVFHGSEAVAREAPGRLVFRLRGESLPVVVESGGTRTAAELSLPVVAAGRMTARLSVAPPPGARILAKGDGVLVGEVGSP